MWWQPSQILNCHKKQRIGRGYPRNIYAILGLTIISEIKGLEHFPHMVLGLTMSCGNCHIGSQIDILTHTWKESSQGNSCGNRHLGIQTFTNNTNFVHDYSMIILVQFLLNKFYSFIEEHIFPYNPFILALVFILDFWWGSKMQN